MGLSQVCEGPGGSVGSRASGPTSRQQWSGQGELRGSMRTVRSVPMRCDSRAGLSVLCPSMRRRVALPSPGVDVRALNLPGPLGFRVLCGSPSGRIRHEIEYLLSWPASRANRSGPDDHRPLHLPHRPEAADVPQRPARRQLERLGRDADDGGHGRRRLPRLHRHGDLRRRRRGHGARTGACGSTAPGGRTRGRSTSRFTTRDSQRPAPPVHPARRRRSSARSATTSRTAAASGRQKILRGRRPRSPAPRDSRSGRRTRRRSRSVFGRTDHGYIDDDGHGHRPRPSRSSPSQRPAAGIWESAPARPTSPSSSACRTCSGSRTPRARPSTAPTSTRAGRSAAVTRTPRRTTGTATRHARRHA